MALAYYAATWTQLSGANAQRIWRWPTTAGCSPYLPRAVVLDVGSWASLSSAVASAWTRRRTAACSPPSPHGVWRWNGHPRPASVRHPPQALVGIKGDYFADFGGAGLHRWTSSGWQQLTSANPFNFSSRR